MFHSSRPTFAEIELEALLHNLRQATRFCGPGQRILAVVKANAYGHGAVAVSKALAAEGVEQFGVAILEEALELRLAGINQPILVFGGCFPGQEEAFLQQRLMPVVCDRQSLMRLNRFAYQRDVRLPVHLKVDTGMGRAGFLLPEFRQLVPELEALDGLSIVGLMSHLACADEVEDDVTSSQVERFRGLIREVRDQGLDIPELHISNSAGLVGWDCPECTLVRPGIMLYGGMPGEKYRDRLDLKPVMHVRTHIAQLKSVPPGTGVSYGHRFHATRQTMLALLPIGYADGYNRLLTNRGEVLIGGRRAPVVGTVCMDWIMIDVTDIQQVAVGDPVTLLGEVDGLMISAEEWAEWLGTISYEIFCRIGARVPRYYPEAQSD
ncbi:MAG TPA: alanine racemase [Geopsychrobacteraceae bacterium]|nr:alanine racemase [Geopsychrobacteraceae bacterium]